MLKLSAIYDIIELKQKEKILSDKVGLETDLEVLKRLLNLVKIQRSDDLEEQKNFIKLNN